MPTIGVLVTGVPGSEKDPPDAVIVQPSLPTTRIAELAPKYRIPAFSPFRPFAEAGGLLSYRLDEAGMWDRMIRIAKTTSV
jgi:hypothetical protein